MNTRARRVAGWVGLRRQLNVSGLTRREVHRMGLLLGGGALLAAPARAWADGQPVSPPTTPWVERLPLPAVLATSPLASPPNPAAHQYYKRFPPAKTYVVRAQERPHSFHPALPDGTIFGYEGVSPGPTIEARYGEPVLVRIVNELPADHKGFGSPQLCTHFHNFHSAPESDGGPWDQTLPGQSRDLHFTMARAGFTDRPRDPGPVPGRARGRRAGEPEHALLPRPRARLHRANVYRGLLGFFRVFDEQDTGDETDPSPRRGGCPAASSTSRSPSATSSSTPTASCSSTSSSPTA